jgi:hypothetical protein
LTNLADKHELWGTFSVMDHRRKGAFLAEIVLYDQLVIPIPPNPERAESDEDRSFASKQWERWQKNDWQPERLEQLVEIMRPVIEPIEWDRHHHQDWVEQFAEYTDKTASDTADLVARMMAGWVTGQVLLSDLPAKAAGAVAVAPFSSLTELTDDLGITESQSLPQRLEASKGLPANVVSAIVGREFLVPADPDWDEFDLLKEAVDLVGNEDYRGARRAFHSEMLRFVGEQQTDHDSVKGALEAMDVQLRQLDQLARSRKRWRRADRAFFFSQIGLDTAVAPLNPVSLLHAGVALGAYTTSEKLGKPADPYNSGPAGALLHDAQRQLGLSGRGERVKPTALQRLQEAVFGRRR